MNLLKICLIALFSSVVAAAQTVPPKVVFIGDWLTAGWDLSSNPNWINKGLPGFNFPGQRSFDVSARFQADVVNLHPAIVHIVVGSVDVATASPAAGPFVTGNVATSIMTMVAEAKAANIKVILGTTPPSAPQVGVTGINAWVEAYGAANNIPVINYADALCGCVGSVGPLGGTGYAYDITPNAPGTHGGFPFIPLMTGTDPTQVVSISTPTAAGYALMTQMVQNTIATVEGVKLTSGWLQNIDISRFEDPESPLPQNFNTILVGHTVQWAPYGAYSDGSYRTLVNTNFAGYSGTWTSSNPAVMYVGQSGLAWPIAEGTTSISYISPTGVHFSPWTITVSQLCGDTVC